MNDHVPNHLTRSLRSRNYRLFVVGQGISLVGTWMQQVAMSWLVYRMTGSAFLLGVVGFASQIPTFLFSPVAGVLADRWNRRTVLITTQAFALLQAAVLAVIVYTESVAVWHLVLLSVVLGVINAFDIPTRQSFIIEMVDYKEDLSNAIALNSSLVNAGRLIGPAIGGLLVASVGEAFCFLLNSLSYLAVIIAYLAMQLRKRSHRESHRHLLRELQDGARYTFGSEPIRTILLLVMIVSLMGMPYAVLVPIFAKEVLGGEAHTFGFLMTAAGSGALIGTIYLASRRTAKGLCMVIAGATAAFSLGIILFTLSHSLYLSLAALVVAGMGAMLIIASSNTILQTIVAEEHRGRVMSFFTMSFMGMTPLGSLGAGVIARHLGVQLTLQIGAVACLVTGIVFARHLPQLKAIILPHILEAEMLQAARDPERHPPTVHHPEPRNTAP